MQGAVRKKKTGEIHRPFHILVLGGKVTLQQIRENFVRMKLSAGGLLAAD